MVMKPPVIIALTANAFQSDREACFEAGMDGFLTKPIKKRDLLRGIGEHLGTEQKKAKY